MESIALLFFLLHQLGMALGLGASTLSLLFSVSMNKSGEVDSSESRLAHLTDVTLYVSLFLLILTGAIITAAHVLAGEAGVVGAPPYLFKWFLLIVACLLAVLVSIFKPSKMEIAILSGATWYTLFIVHTTALSVGFSMLFGLYVGMLVLFGVGFMLLRLMNGSGGVREIPRIPQPTPTPSRYTPPAFTPPPAPRHTPPPVIEKPIMPQPPRPTTVMPQTPPTAPVMQRPVMPQAPVQRPPVVTMPTQPLRPVTVMPQAPISKTESFNPLTTAMPVTSSTVEFTLPSEQKPPQQ